MDVLDRARSYLRECPPAISGQNGHTAAFVAAVKVIHGFDLSEADGLMLLREWNATCQPPWSEKELIHKVEEAAKKANGLPRGHLLGTKFRDGVRAYSERRSAFAATPSFTAAQPHPVAPPIEVPDSLELPEPLPDATRQLLKACFKTGECIRIAPATINDEGKEEPEGKGPALSREEWLSMLDAKDGDPNKLWSQSSGAGIYIGINPLDGEGVNDVNVRSYRHALIEFDDLPVEQQWALYQQTNLPCAAIIHSGKRSLHAWVRVDARDKQEFDERVRFLQHYFAPHGACGKNKNPSRLSRLPGCRRFEKRQELWALSIGAQSWEDWHDEVRDTGLPKPISIGEFIGRQIAHPVELVEGVLHQASKMVIGGTSKSHKTFCLIDLGVAVGSGTDWWGCKTTKGRVLYINFEIQDFFMQYRMKEIMARRGVSATDCLLDVWNLRGHSASIDVIIPKILHGMRKLEYRLVIIDPIYKALGSRDENKAGDIAELMNEVERLAVKSLAAVVFGGHFAKGQQSSKTSMDRMSGSGVFARDPDSILTLTPHSEKDCFTVEYTLRNFKPRQPVVVRWQYPVFSIDLALDPLALQDKKAQSNKKEKRKWDADDVLPHVVPGILIPRNELNKALHDAGCPKDHTSPIIQKAIRQKMLHCWTVREKGKRGYEMISREPRKASETLESEKPS